MRADVKFTTTVEEATVIIEALQQAYKLHLFNYGAVAATEEEKRESGAKILQVESILRQMGSTTGQNHNQ